MTSKTLIKLLAGAALATVMTASAHAQITNFDGYSSAAGGGNSGTDAQGNPWTWSAAGTDSSAWGAPGLGDGTSVFTTTTDYSASDFAVTFIGFPVPVIDQSPSPEPGGYNTFTRFTSDVDGNLYAWTPDYSYGSNTVVFTAPSAAADLTNGDLYFVNVVFSTGGLDGSNTGFTAAFSTETVPEPSTWAMLGLGFAGLAFAGYRSRRSSAAIA